MIESNLDEEDDFASYYNPDLAVENNLQRQSLNHSRNMAGISINRSLAVDKPKEKNN